MNIALLTAGGIGNRMEIEIPKQFMTIYEKPVIIYTLESFQVHPEIDAIAVVCLTGWESMLWAYANQYHISKLKWIFPGGETNQDSIINGIDGLINEGCDDNDIVLVHDGVRPLVSERIITENISTCKKYGYAVTGLICKEVIMEIKEGSLFPIGVTRDQLVRTQTPHTYFLSNLNRVYKYAKEKKINNTIAPCDMMAKVGNIDQHFVLGSEKNGLKLTRPDDLDIFKSLIALEKINK